MNAKGVTQNSLRTLSEEDFSAIVDAGMARLFDATNAPLFDVDGVNADPSSAELFELNPEARRRRIEQVLLNRLIREAAFRSTVREAYEFTCAMTGLSVRNGGGRPEVHAAHIQAVEDGGPDIVQNGIALSQTFHWVFDRGLIGIRDDYSIIVSHNKVPPELGY